MAKHDVIPFSEESGSYGGGMDMDKLDKRFDYIYREAIKTLFNKNSNGC